MFEDPDHGENVPLAAVVSSTLGHQVSEERQILGEQAALCRLIGPSKRAPFAAGLEIPPPGQSRGAGFHEADSAAPLE